MDYFFKRFPSRTRRFFELYVKSGHIVVNTEKVDVDYVTRENDLVSCVTHCHETEVLDMKVRMRQMNSRIR